MILAGSTSRRHVASAAVRRAGPPLAVAAIGWLLWAAAAGSGFLRLSWSDEIIYAAMGRNVALSRGFVSTFCDAQSIAERGCPQEAPVIAPVTRALQNRRTTCPLLLPAAARG
jgi:hypothetical protein